MNRAFKSLWHELLGACAGVLLMACGTASHRPPRTYAQSVDSATNSCGRSPTLCKPQVGERLSVVPPPRPPLSGAARAAVDIAAALRVVQVAIDASLNARIQKALSECADEARSTVMIKHFENRGPTREECNEVLRVSGNGEPFTRAMQLGLEQHQLALSCAEQRLQELKPGGFSLSPRYRIDPATGRAQYLPREQVEELLRQGRGSELLGTIEPDVVIHNGQPQLVQAVYDFKFPCVNGGEPPWRRYPAGHPHHKRSQGEVYHQALGVEPKRIIPHQGTLR